ncbi:MAG: conjugal transfer protein TraX [Bacilli bacterium]|nr:conjugal transfer protein TraX [Bacilli bacterium]
MERDFSFQKLSSFLLKVFAMIFMVVDHVGIFLNAYAAGNEAMYNAAHICRLLGRIAFPLFIFMLSEGMRFTHDPKKYLLRLSYIWLPMIVAQTIDCYALNNQFGIGYFANPFTDLLCVGATLWMLRNKGAKKLYALIPAGYVILSYILNVYEHANNVTIHWLPALYRCDYSIFGLALGVGFFYGRDVVYLIGKKTLADMGISRDVFEESSQGRSVINAYNSVVLFVVNAALWGISFIGATANRSPFDPFYMSTFQAWSLLAMPFLLLYNGRRGYDSKWFRVFSYLFFVVHLVLIFAIFRVSFGY